MNFKEFVETGKLEKFRSVKIDLTEEDSEVNELVEEVAQEFELDDLLELRNMLNDELKKKYRGKLKIDYVLDEYINTDKRTKNLKNKMITSLFEANDKVAKAKTKLERLLGSGLE